MCEEIFRNTLRLLNDNYLPSAKNWTSLTLITNGARGEHKKGYIRNEFSFLQGKYMSDLRYLYVIYYTHDWYIHVYIRRKTQLSISGLNKTLLISLLSGDKMLQMYVSSVTLFILKISSLVMWCRLSWTGFLFSVPLLADPTVIPGTISAAK